ncbi:glycosyltransferase [Alteromonas sp. 1_MG-2023]|uniref:glycosyltransferase n=1 Tax=Alteromonas sp. 1_MG-2023 TaxID=3062669 RepID=UPI0026E348EC|nr:glycosyltransferase [Alteromonas sp. 1_MG-2023]MDO6475431.1 glycosyltransferase [Alteromonas sp. 1_MG-2023]
MAKKILFVASIGGHLVQLLRLKTLTDKYDSVLVTTKFVHEPNFDSSYVVPDINQQSSKLFMLKSLIKYIKIFFKEKPDVIITTGALPGLVFVILAKLFFKKSIWIDSIANAAELSKSGKIASKYSTVCLSQWPDLSDGKVVKYIGKVI